MMLRIHPATAHAILALANRQREGFMFGIKLWYTPGNHGCDRCGSKDGLLASPGFFTMQLWCARCLRKAGIR